MVDEKLKQYVSQAREQNISDIEIKNNLLKSGWNEENINIALNPPQLTVPSPSHNSTDEIKGNPNMWDAFQHIIMFISLYVFATTLGLLLIHYIDNVWFLKTTYNFGYSRVNERYSSLLAGYYSSLIVSGPIFLSLFLIIRRKTRKNILIKEIKARKTLTYMTLILTFITFMSRLIYLIYTFLNGDISINIIFKFLVIAGISGAIFIYYVNQVKQDRKDSSI